MLALATALAALAVLRFVPGASGAEPASFRSVSAAAIRSASGGGSCVAGDMASTETVCQANVQPVAVLSAAVGAPPPDPVPADPVPADPAPVRAVPAPAGSPAPVPAAPAPAVEPNAEVTPAPATERCRAVVLVHGGGYFMGDASVLEASFAEPLRRNGYRVWNVDYPLLGDWPDLSYDDAHPWYPRPDVDSAPPALRIVHDRATDAVAPAVVEALGTGCTVALLGVSAGASIVADLAFRYPVVAVAVLVVGASLTPDRIGGAPLEIFYGGADDVVLPRATIDTCERWRATGSICAAHRFEGQGHDSPVPPAAALAYLLAAA